MNINEYDNKVYVNKLNGIVYTDQDYHVICAFFKALYLLEVASRDTIIHTVSEFIYFTS